MNGGSRYNLTLEVFVYRHYTAFCLMNVPSLSSGLIQMSRRPGHSAFSLICTRFIYRFLLLRVVCQWSIFFLFHPIERFHQLLRTCAKYEGWFAKYLSSKLIGDAFNGKHYSCVATCLTSRIWRNACRIWFLVLFHEHPLKYNG